MTWLIGHWNSLWVVAAKAALLYGVTLVGLRWATRRTLAQMSAFDFVTAVAMGAIIGRTATATGTSFVEGAAAVATLIALHRLVALARMLPGVARLTDHRVRVLVADGRLLPRQLALCGLLRVDVEAALRQHGITDLAGVRYVLYEHAGGLTIVGAENSAEGALLTAALRAAPDATAPQSA